MNNSFICKELVKLFGYPCEYVECEKVLHKNAKSMAWCEQHCNAVFADKCWQHYFQIIEKENKHGNSQS